MRGRWCGGGLPFTILGRSSRQETTRSRTARRAAADDDGDHMRCPAYQSSDAPTAFHADMSAAKRLVLFTRFDDDAAYHRHQVVRAGDAHA